jgi:type IV pilus assembly protein PilM
VAMFESDRILALDLGASKIVLAEFHISKAGDLELMRYGICPTGAETKSESDKLAYIVTAIRDIMREQGIRPAPMLMTVSGQAVFPRFVKLPPVGRDKLKQIVQYEAEQNVPFPIDEVVWDYQLIGGDEGELNVMLVAVKIENIKRLTDAVQAAELEPEIVDVAPMALYNAVRFNYPDLDVCSMVLDMGARSSNLVFIEENRIFSRSIPVAGNTITQELMKEFDVDFDAAEAIKREHGFVAFGGVYAGPDNETAERASKIIRSVLTRLHAEVNRSINFYRSQQGGAAPSIVFLTGGSSIIPHVDTFFRDKLKVDVEYLNPFSAVSVAESIDADRVNRDLQSLGEIVGLALRRALTCPVEINLMPPDLVARKAFRRRQPFFAMSAAGIVLTMLCWWVYFNRMGRMFEDRVNDVSAEVKAFQLLTAELNRASDEREEAVQRLGDVAGVIGMRRSWGEILNAVHRCMQEGMWVVELNPRPQGQTISHVDLTVQGFSDRLIDNDKGTASERFRDRLRATEQFGDKTEIVSERAVGSGDYLRRFKIDLELDPPLVVK